MGQYLNEIQIMKLNKTLKIVLTDFEVIKKIKL